MRLETLWPRHIPKGLVLSREEYLDVKDAAKRLRCRDDSSSWGLMKSVAILVALCLPAYVAFAYVLFRLVLTPSGFPLEVLLAAQLAYTFFVSWYLMRHTQAPSIRRALCEVGHEVCIKCGYLLIGLPETTLNCPECGAMRVNRHKAQVARQEQEEENPLPKYRWD